MKVEKENREETREKERIIGTAWAGRPALYSYLTEIQIIYKTPLRYLEITKKPAYNRNKL